MNRKIVKLLVSFGAVSSAGLISAVTLTSCTTATGPKKEINKSELRTINNILSNCLNGTTPSIEVLNSSQNIASIKQKICNDLKISDPSNIKKVQFESVGSDKYLYNAVVEFNNEAISIDVDKDKYFIIVQNLKDDVVTLTTKEAIRFVDESQTKGIFINTNQLHNTIQNYISNYNFLVDLNSNSPVLVNELNVSDAFEFNGGKVNDIVFDKCKEDNTKINVNVVFSKEVEQLDGDKFEYSQPSKKSIANTKANCFSMDEGFNFTERLLNDVQKNITNYLTTKNSIDDLNGEAINMLKEAISKTTSINPIHITSLVFTNVGTDLDDIKLSITFDKKIRITDSSGQIQTTFNDFEIINDDKQLEVNNLHYNAEINIVDPSGLFATIETYVKKYHFLNDMVKNKQQLLNSIVNGSHLYIKTNGGSLDDIRFTSTTQNTVKVSLVFSKQTSIENDTAKKFTVENNGLIYNTTTPITFEQGVEIGGLDEAQKTIQEYVNKYHQLTDLNNTNNINTLKTSLQSNITVTNGLTQPTIENVEFKQGNTVDFVNVTITFDNFVQPLDATSGFLIENKTITLLNLTYIDGVKVLSTQKLFDALQTYVNGNPYLSGLNKKENIDNLKNELNENATIFCFNGGKITNISFEIQNGFDRKKVNVKITFSRQVFITGENQLFGYDTTNNPNKTILTMTSTYLDFNEAVVIENTDPIFAKVNDYVNSKHTINEMNTDIETLKNEINPLVKNSLKNITFTKDGSNLAAVLIEFNKNIGVKVKDETVIVGKRTLSKNSIGYIEAIEITNAASLLNTIKSFVSKYTTIDQLINKKDFLLTTIRNGAYGSVFYNEGNLTDISFTNSSSQRNNSGIDVTMTFDKYTITNDSNTTFTSQDPQTNLEYKTTSPIPFNHSCVLSDLTPLYEKIVEYVRDKHTINDLNNPTGIGTLKTNLETSIGSSGVISTISFTNANSSNVGANVDIEFNDVITVTDKIQTSFNVGLKFLKNKRPITEYIQYENISNFVNVDAISDSVSKRFNLSLFPTRDLLQQKITEVLPTKGSIQAFLDKISDAFSINLPAMSSANVVVKELSDGSMNDLITFNILFRNYQYAIFDILVIPVKIMTVENNSWKALARNTNVDILDLRHYNFTSVDTDGSVQNKGVIGNNNVSTIYLPDTVTNIGVNAFLNCTTIRNIKSSQGDYKLPPYVRNICRKAFSGCSSLTNLQYPTGCVVATDAFTSAGTSSGTPYNPNLPGTLASRNFKNEN